MTSLKIVLAKTKADALAQKIILERKGYTVAVPVFYEKVSYKGGDAGGVDDAVERVWVVQGTK